MDVRSILSNEISVTFYQNLIHPENALLCANIAKMWIYQKHWNKSEALNVKVTTLMDKSKPYSNSYL